MTMWTDKREEDLKKYWAQGLSATQIAKNLGGVSRNAVIGKVHRLGLPGRSKAHGNRPKAEPGHVGLPITPSISRKARAVTLANSSISVSRAATKPKDVTTEDEGYHFRPNPSIIMPVSRQLELTALTERTCKWPVGDPQMEGFSFCGTDATGSPYCTYHQRVAYQPMRERKRGRKPAEANLEYA